MRPPLVLLRIREVGGKFWTKRCYRWRYWWQLRRMRMRFVGIFGTMSSAVDDYFAFCRWLLLATIEHLLVEAARPIVAPK